MRELPYMKATTSLERSLNLDKIYERAQNFNKINNSFAAKGYNRRGIIYDIDNVKITKPYDGADHHTENTKGMVTFKVKKEQSERLSSNLSSRNNMESKPKSVASTQATLTNEEIKEICDKHHLERNEVYNIRSTFSSMC